MNIRRQLPVSSPLLGKWILDAAYDTLNFDSDQLESLRNTIKHAFGACTVALTNSGTSALVLALRLTVPPGGTVGLPGYGCPNLIAAARFAGVHVRLYDLDPTSLSPDLASVEKMLQRGVHTMIVTHLYGYPADVPAMQNIAAAHDITVVEDAAQGAGGTLAGVPLGGIGPISILSFGRGKGITAGNGGALLAIDNKWTAQVNDVSTHLGNTSPGWGHLGRTALQWAFGRPAFYSIPSAIPWLKLGEMVYNKADEPGMFTRSGTSLLSASQNSAKKELAIRIQNARVLESVIPKARGIRSIRPIISGTSGYLRFPVLDTRGRREAPELGIVRGYPCAMIDQWELRSCLHGSEPVPTGCEELSRSLFTLPVHSHVTKHDLHAATEWLQ